MWCSSLTTTWSSEWWLPRVESLRWHAFKTVLNLQENIVTGWLAACLSICISGWLQWLAWSHIVPIDWLAIVSFFPLSCSVSCHHAVVCRSCIAAVKSWSRQARPPWLHSLQTRYPMSKVRMLLPWLLVATFTLRIWPSIWNEDEHSDSSLYHASRLILLNCNAVVLHCSIMLRCVLLVIPRS